MDWEVGDWMSSGVATIKGGASDDKSTEHRLSERSRWLREKIRSLGLPTETICWVDGFRYYRGSRRLLMLIANGGAGS